MNDSIQFDASKRFAGNSDSSAMAQCDCPHLSMGTGKDVVDG